METKDLNKSDFAVIAKQRCFSTICLLAQRSRKSMLNKWFIVMPKA